jgi:hypothetical protein
LSPVACNVPSLAACAWAQAFPCNARWSAILAHLGEHAFVGGPVAFGQVEKHLCGKGVSSTIAWMQAARAGTCGPEGRT